MVSMKISKHIYLDKTFLFFLIVIVLTGNFNGFLKCFFLLMIHETGHAASGVILGYKLEKISFYPYGGITSFSLPINIPLKEELFILIMGPIMQIIGYLFLRNYVSNLETCHYTLLLFNLLPIYPLDGGRILNIFINFFFDYLLSIKITFFISFFVGIMIFTYYVVNININVILTLSIIIIKLIQYFKKKNYYFYRFLLERHLYCYSFKKIKDVNNIKKFQRGYYHFINKESEKNFLKKYFQENSCINFKI